MPPGLRERKRAAAMRRIQEAALDLFDARGYQQVTIEEIAAAAEVSPSSVYRYFGTKEQLVLYDELDEQLIDMIPAELAAHPPVEALRRAIARTMAQLFGREEELARRKTRYWFEEPAIQAAAAQQTDAFARVVGDALAHASGHRPGALEPQVAATALVWTMVAAARYWHTTDYREPLDEVLERALNVVENGLRLA